MFEVVLTAIFVVVTVNEAVEAPVATVTEAGTCASGELEDSATVIAAGAFPERVNVAVVDAPPRRLADPSVTAMGTGGTIPSKNVFVTPKADALSVD